MARRLALIRHGPTRWNDEGRIQGWTDVGLGARGRAAVAAWRLPPALRGAAWTASPLLRAVHTAALLAPGAATFEPRLVEMRWGAWEGRTIAALRAADPAGLAEIEARGLDFRPPGGESPRALQARLAPWLAETAAAGGATLAAVTHKGVIRAVLARALDWDMTGAAPVALDWTAAHLFRLEADGSPRVERLNLGLARTARAAR